MPISRNVHDPWELPAEQRQTTCVGRERILDRLVAAVREQEGRDTVQHYILTGPRGIGKTTLLLILRDRIRQDPEASANWFCVQLREEEYYIHKQRDLWQLVLQALAVDEKLAEAQEVADLAQEARDEEKSSALLVDGLRSICNRHGKRLLLLIDNFDHIFPSTAAGQGKHRKADSEYRAFRKRLGTEPFLMTIATSVKLFEDIYAYDQGFFHFFSPVELRELGQDEAAEMLRRLGRADDNAEFLSKLDRSTVNLQTLWVLTGGNPRLIAMLYHILCQREIREPVQALWETVAGLTPMLRQELADMPRQQSKTLDALLRLNAAAAPAEISKTSRLPLNVVTAQLGRLREARYVMLEGGGKGKKATYRVADQMFRVWYCMRYVPAARRRIELFIDFLRAWFSLDERRRLFEERWKRFQTNRAQGFVGLAGRTLRDAEYYAASLDDLTERRTGMERVADAYITVGDLRSAAGLLAEVAGATARSMSEFETLGYSVLTRRLLEKGDTEHAMDSCTTALAKNPKNVEARATLGICLSLCARYAEATQQFDRVLKRRRLNTTMRSQVLLTRGTARGGLGDRQGEIADYNTLVDLAGAPVEIVAFALVRRGLAKGQLGDPRGEIADQTTAAQLMGAPAALVGLALLSRGLAKRRLGDPQGEMEDYSAVLELKDAPPLMVSKALFIRGLTRDRLGDSAGAIADYTAVVELQGAAPEAVAHALLSRGLLEYEAGDTKGSIADFSVLMDLKGAPPEAVATALAARGAAKAQLGDFKGAIADCTALLGLKGAPPTIATSSLLLRGLLYDALGQYERALADLSVSLEAAGLPERSRVEASYARGVAYQNLGQLEEALADYARCAQSGIMPYVHSCLQLTVHHLLSGKRGNEALAWARRFHDLEPSDLPFDTRLLARVSMIVGACATVPLDDVSRLVDALLETDPEELRDRLRFLKPGLELARTNDESVLAKLPEEERKIAKEIARSLAGAARQPMAKPASASS
jgi:tetratricopeptide (TPR) repeat protein